MSQSTVRQRTEVIAVRVTREERERFAGLAVRMGRSLPDLMRLAVETALLQESMQEVSR